MSEENSQILDVRANAQRAIRVLIYLPILTLITIFVERQEMTKGAQAKDEVKPDQGSTICNMTQTLYGVTSFRAPT